MSRKVNRRKFLQAGGISAAAAGFWLTGVVTESFAAQPAGERLNIAIIGCGGQGGGNAGQTAIRNENIVALCDVDSNRARGVFDRYPKVNKYTDFRVMLDKQKDIQAVVVSTPDHTHFQASDMAIQRGKHVYTEKPLTHSVWEARQLKLLASKHKVATSMGNQGTSHDGLRTAAEIIRSGAIGEVRECHVWTNRPIWPQGIDRPKDRPAAPKHLEWDLWLGPAPERPYHGAYVPFAWRGWWDFGTGALGDMACHTMNMPYMALRLGAPTSVVAELTTPPAHPEAAPMGCLVTYQFPARENLPACTLYWYERRKPPREKFLDTLAANQEPPGSGVLIVGSRGTLYNTSDYGDNRRLAPAENFANYQPPEPSLPRSPGHHAEWVRACKGGPAAMSNFPDYAGPLTEMVLLGNVAMRTGQRIEWDSANLRVTNSSAAAQYIKREYRRGWEIAEERAPRVVRAQSANGTSNNSAPAPESRPARFPLLRRLLRRN
jgi:predicted dehydrogenase